MGRLDYLAKRVLKALVILLAIAVMNFCLIRLAPGDPASVIAGEAGAADAKYMEQLRHQFGLDLPLSSQLWIYVKNVVALDLGFSYRNQRTVAAMVFERLPATLLLTLTAFALALAGGIFLGVLAATHAGSWADSLITVLALGFYATPLFWVGLMLILLFSVNLGWVPAFGMEQVGQGLVGIERSLDIAHHLILPAITLGLFFVAIYARLTRASMLEVRDMDFVRTARAKGLSEHRIVRVHMLKNAILPVITFAGIQAGQLVGGSIVVETVFAWPGIGRLAFEALLQRDYNLLLGVFFLTSVMVVVFNLLTDLVYSLADPRIEVAA
ncbi:MAG: ABC transporter permease [Proteobacteria bacterium]|nr:ABC transporter permease [Pseudomonadota bacterium]MBI3498059.1 ABC transporter permease [Pseudomonadota bacterium]